MIMFIIGVLILIAGVFIVIKTETMLEAFGRMDFFERNMGTSGGSRLGYKLIGVGFILIGMMAISGLLEGFMSWLASPLTRFNS